MTLARRHWPRAVPTPKAGRRHAEEYPFTLDAMGSAGTNFSNNAFERRAHAAPTAPSSVRCGTRRRGEVWGSEVSWSEGARVGVRRVATMGSIALTTRRSLVQIQPPPPIEAQSRAGARAPAPARSAIGSAIAREWEGSSEIVQRVPSRSRIQSLVAAAATVLPWASASVGLAPWPRSTTIIRPCSSFARSEPELLLPVF